jgi:preprotein translocase subunit YajC
MFKIIFQSFVALAQETGGASTPPGPTIWESFIIPMGAFFLIFFFLVIRPQARKAKEAQEILKSLKKGDQVLTSGGILGTIVGVSDVFVDLKASDSTRFKVLKTGVTPYTEKPKSKS